MNEKSGIIKTLMLIILNKQKFEFPLNNSFANVNEKKKNKCDYLLKPSKILITSLITFPVKPLYL